MKVLDKIGQYKQDEVVSEETIVELSEGDIVRLRATSISLVARN